MRSPSSDKVQTGYSEHVYTSDSETLPATTSPRSAQAAENQKVIQNIIASATKVSPNI